MFNQFDFTLINQIISGYQAGLFVVGVILFQLLKQSRFIILAIAAASFATLPLAIELSQFSSVIIAITIVFMLLFNTSELALSLYDDHLHRVSLAIIPLTLIIGILGVFVLSHHHVGIFLAQSLIPIVMIWLNNRSKSYSDNNNQAFIILWSAMIATSLLLAGVHLFELSSFSILNLLPLQYVFISLGCVYIALLSFTEKNAQDIADTESLENQLQQHNLELKEALIELEQKNKQLEERSTLDALTGIKNRRYFDTRYQMESRKSRRELSTLSIAILDIDHFKRVNDDYGHLAGDDVIKQVAQLAQSKLNRPSDVVCRYGGEEFCLILPNTEADGALLVAESIRKAIETNAFNTCAGKLDITISIGVCSMIVDLNEAENLLIDNADQALYKAKENGRNQTQVFNQLTKPQKLKEY